MQSMFEFHGFEISASLPSGKLPLADCGIGDFTIILTINSNALWVEAVVVSQVGTSLGYSKLNVEMGNLIIASSTS